MNHFNENLKDLRKNYKYTQEELAKILNIKQATYCRYEKGTREPTLDTLIKLADIFDTTIDDLIR